MGGLKKGWFLDERKMDSSLLLIYTTKIWDSSHMIYKLKIVKVDLG